MVLFGDLLPSWYGLQSYCLSWIYDLVLAVVPGLHDHTIILLGTTRKMQTGPSPVKKNRLVGTRRLRNNYGHVPEPLGTNITGKRKNGNAQKASWHLDRNVLLNGAVKTWRLKLQSGDYCRALKTSVTCLTNRSLRTHAYSV